MGLICQYCSQEARLITGKDLYPHRPDLSYLKFWYCDNGHEAAYVGCHRTNVKLGYTGTEPLDTLADSTLRQWRGKAHAAFDPLWKDKKFKSRKSAYRWLANVLNIAQEECHMALFNIDRCKEVISAVERWKSTVKYQKRSFHI